MPEDNEKVEDFISLWRKKMENEIKPSKANGETLEKIKEVEVENEQLRNKIKENIELITKTEEIIKKTIEENENLKKQLEKAGIFSEQKVSEIQQENATLNNKLKNLEVELNDKENELRIKDNEITELKDKLELSTKISKPIETPSTGKDSEVTTILIEDLQSELSKKKTQIEEQEKRIDELMEENEVLNQKLIEKMKKLPIDYVVPVPEPKSTVIKPQSTKPSSEMLEILCQDLQSDLNKYKRIVDKLNSEKSELERTIESGGFQLEPDELKELKKENEDLKKEISQIQVSLQNDAQEKAWASQISIAEQKLNNLQNQLKEKDRLIAELKASQQTQPIVHEGPMSGLIEDLQNRINKLKVTIEEKNKIIDELKSS